MADLMSCLWGRRGWFAGLRPGGHLARRALARIGSRFTKDPHRASWLTGLRRLPHLPQMRYSGTDNGST